MRRPLTILLALILISFSIFTFLRIQAFVHLFFTHAGISITQQEIKDAFLNDTAAGFGHGHTHRPQLIPKIIHQVFHSWREEGDGDEEGKEKMPNDWVEVSKSCKDFHKDWEYNVCLLNFLILPFLSSTFIF